MITVLALIGFAYGVDELYDIARVTGVSLANSWWCSRWRAPPRPAARMSAWPR
jgi:hypothetical protein